MNKAILVIDIPECCSECPLCIADEYNTSHECCMKYKGYVDAKSKPTWCPLKPLPTKCESCIHTQKTRQSEFVKLFPHAVLAFGVLRIDPCDIESKSSFPCTYVDGEKNCALCRKKYWLKEIK